jgi:hypothetical protein
MKRLKLMFFPPRQQGKNYPFGITFVAKDTYIFPLYVLGMLLILRLIGLVGRKLGFILLREFDLRHERDIFICW